MKNKELIESIQKGNIESFEELMREHLPAVKSFIAFRLPVHHLIDELAHETFVYAYRNIDEFKPGTNFSSWLKAIANNLVRAEILKYARTGNNKQKYMEHQIIELADSQTGKGSDEAIHLENCILKLPELFKKLLDLKYEKSFSTREMSEALNKSESWIRTTLFRVRTLLKECIQEQQTSE